MKSRITIEVDFENGNQPIIKVHRVPSSDVRDSLINSFFAILGDELQYAKIVFKEYHVETGAVYHIQPIRPDDFKKESLLMTEQVKSKHKKMIEGGEEFLAPGVLGK